MLEVEYLGNRQWRILKDLEKDGVTVPKDFITDLATTPRILWIFFPPEGDYAPASAVHDYLYSIMAPRHVADKTFYRIMRQDKVFIVTRVCLYVGVRAGGWWKYYKISQRIYDLTIGK